MTNGVLKKEQAWNKCYDEYCNTEGAEQFGICSHNSFSFTVSWFTPNGMRLETSKKIVILWFFLINNQIGVVVGTIQGSIPCTPFSSKMG